MATVIDSAVESASSVFILPGQTESGDHCLVTTTPYGSLLAVVDGLGHGREAAHAANRAIAAIRDHAVEPIVELAQRCHADLNSTRGAVMNLASFDTRRGTLSWLGIGNVEGRLLLRLAESGYQQQHLLLRPGVIGQRLPKLQVFVNRVERGDVLIFATDGISPEFADHLPIDAPVEDIADSIIARHCKRTDDALVLVARYLG